MAISGLQALQQRTGTPEELPQMRQQDGAQETTCHGNPEYPGLCRDHKSAGFLRDCNYLSTKMKEEALQRRSWYE
jgi:hypothetical protein